MMETILEYRAYAAAKAANDADPKGAQGSALRQVAQRIEFELVQEEINSRHGEN